MFHFGIVTFKFVLVYKSSLFHDTDLKKKKGSLSYKVSHFSEFVLYPCGKTWLYHSKYFGRSKY